VPRRLNDRPPPRPSVRQSVGRSHLKSLRLLHSSHQPQSLRRSQPRPPTRCLTGSFPRPPGAAARLSRRRLQRRLWRDFSAFPDVQTNSVKAASLIVSSVWSLFHRRVGVNMKLRRQNKGRHNLVRYIRLSVLPVAL